MHTCTHTKPTFLRLPTTYQPPTSTTTTTTTTTTIHTQVAEVEEALYEPLFDDVRSSPDQVAIPHLFSPAPVSFLFCLTLAYFFRAFFFYHVPRCSFAAPLSLSLYLPSSSCSSWIPFFFLVSVPSHWIEFLEVFTHSLTPPFALLAPLFTPLPWPHRCCNSWRLSKCGWQVYVQRQTRTQSTRLC